MRIYRQFLICMNIFLLGAAFFTPALAQGDLPDIVKRITPSVVVIFTYDEQGKAIIQGSGFFIDDKGDVITNRHVLEGASRAEVKTIGDEIYPVKKVLAEDREGDLIRVSVDIPQKAVRPLSVSATSVEVGERIVVIGSPLGLERTVSDGIVSAVRDIPAFGKIIQLTAPMSEGSSGSPVVNMKGEVIGVATFRMVEGQALNFAIPVERVLNLKPGKGRSLTKWRADEIIEELAAVEELYYAGFLDELIEDCEKVFNYFELATIYNPSNVRAYLGLGYCYRYKGLDFTTGKAIKDQIAENTNRAFEALKQAIVLDPDYALAHFEIASVYEDLNRYKEAVQSYKRAIQLRPDFVIAHAHLGSGYMELGFSEKAIKAHKQAIFLNPDSAWAHFLLGLTYLDLEDEDSALLEYIILLRLDKNMAGLLKDFIVLSTK